MTLNLVLFNNRLDELRTAGSIFEIDGEDKVRRWIVRGGIFVVTETTQPNCWMSRKMFDFFPSLLTLGIKPVYKSASARTKRKGKVNPGRHSNVHSSRGFGDIDLVKLRFETIKQLNNAIDAVVAAKWSRYP
jgi:hypothetical protein